MTRVISTEPSADVMPLTSDSSAFAVSGAVICHPPLSFLSAVASPSAVEMCSSSIVSAWSPANTFSCFDPDSVPVSDFFDRYTAYPPTAASTTVNAIADRRPFMD